jgi:hypothetical protein
MKEATTFTKYFTLFHHLKWLHNEAYAYSRDPAVYKIDIVCPTLNTFPHVTCKNSKGLA